MRKYLAEFFGTFVLVFGGVGSAVLAGGKIGYFGVSMAFGLSLLAMAYTVGPISGCHINPAVTFGAFISKRIAARDAGAYVLAQCVGAIVGAGAVLAVARGIEGGYHAQIGLLGANGYGLHSPGGYSMTSAFLAEAILTFFLVLTVLGSTDVKAPVGFAGIPIGLVLVLIHLVGIPITNTSVNPARSLGPALFVRGWALQQLWLFWLAPLFGALVAAFIYRMVRLPDPIISTKTGERALPSEQLEKIA